MENNKIEFELSILNDKQINSYENEYSQVILNLLTNSKDALLSRDINEAKIEIIIVTKDNYSTSKNYRQWEE